MALSALEICNRALNALGAERITAFDDGTRNAALCDALYESMRDELISDHPWNFAQKRASLAASATAPVFGYTAAYPLPSDCVRVLQLDSVFNDEDWAIENGELLCDLSGPIYIRYLSNSVSPVVFAPKFVAALVLRLAIELAIPITESMSKREGLEKAFMMAIRSARGTDAREHGPERLRADTLIDARR